MTCIIEDCGSAAVGQGLCHKHYERNRRNGTPLLDKRAPEKHGMRHTSEYRIWCLMKGRCLNPSNHDYAYYGGRGIEVCQQWKDSFIAFHNDMGDRPSSNHSIDRVNNNLGYSPDNCRWATRLEQGNNTRRNKFITFRGETKSIARWASELGINRQTLYTRLNELGWSVSKALSKEV